MYIRIMYIMYMSVRFLAHKWQLVRWAIYFTSWTCTLLPYVFASAVVYVSEKNAGVIADRAGSCCIHSGWPMRKPLMASGTRWSLPVSSRLCQ